MTVFDVLSLIGGLCLFLFGMNIMGDSLERRAGGKLELILGKLTKNKFKAFLTGMGVTAVIQSSSATTVMVVGFVNSGIMTLKQSIGVIMGANIGTTVTAWVLSLGGISGDNIIVQLLKPTSFTPVLALVGTIMILFDKMGKKKDVGMILLGFATLMFGMDTMSDAVAGLADNQAFCNLFIMFKNPILGVLVGMVLTAVIQSSSASVGILQALSVTGQVSYGATIPIVMGQNIGTCVTALLSSVGATRNARRAAVVHLSFNIIGTVVWLSVFSLISFIFKPAILDASASYMGIAVAHTLFNLLCTLLLLPMSRLLEKIAVKLVPDSKEKETVEELDARLLATPTVAIDRCNELVKNMAADAVDSIGISIKNLLSPGEDVTDRLRDLEEKTDHYEDIIGTYLIKLSKNKLTGENSRMVSKLLKVIGDFERMADHSMNLLQSADELKTKKIKLTDSANAELETICAAVTEISRLSKNAFCQNSLEDARRVEPLEQVVDELKDLLRDRHILRLKEGECSVEAGFIWSDLLTNLERISDHCSNIAVSVIDAAEDNMNLHESARNMRHQDYYNSLYNEYSATYAIKA